VRAGLDTARQDAADALAAVQAAQVSRSELEAEVALLRTDLDTARGLEAERKGRRRWARLRAAWRGNDVAVRSRTIEFSVLRMGLQLGIMPVPVTAVHWLIRAADAREDAAAMTSPEAQRVMLFVAAGYDRLAQYAASIERSGLLREMAETDAD